MLLLNPISYNELEVWTPTFVFSFSYIEPLGEEFELLRIRTDTNEVYHFSLLVNDKSEERTLWMNNYQSK